MLEMQDVFRVLYNGYNLIVVQDTNLATVYLKTSARISSKNHPILLFAPRSLGKLFGIFVGKGTGL